MFIQTKLDNNIKVLLIPVKNTKIIQIKLLFRIGSDLETTKNLEVTHFLEHMFGAYTSEKYPNSYQLLEKIVSLGIENDASVGYSITKYYLRGLSKHFDFMLDILYNAYANFKIDTKYLEQERNSIIEEINIILNDGWIKLTEDINKHLFPNHNRELSQKHNIRNVKKLQVTELMRFFKKYYNNQNLIISIGGDFTPGKILKKLNQTFGKISNNNKVSLFPYIKKTIKKPIVSFTVNNQTMSSNLYIIFRIPYDFYDKDKFIIYTMANIMTNGLDSRLYKRLRGNAGLVYSISSDVELSYSSKTLSNFSLNTQVLDQNLIAVIDIIIDELYKLREKPITNQELQKHQSEVKVTFLSNKLDRDPYRLLNKYSKYILWEHQPITEKEEYSLMMNIKRKDIQEVSRKVLDMSQIMIIYSGKKNQNREIYKILNKYGIM